MVSRAIYFAAPIVLHNMREKRFDQRLAGAIPYLRKGKVLSDVGTDHAHLPIYACQNGICPRAVASDINRGPVENARRNIAAAGLTDKIATVCTPGLDGIQAYAPEDITIFGMGGELIASIIDAAPWTRDARIRLVLQPMSHAEILRAYLLQNGFCILDQTLVKEDKVYQIICAEYDGIARSEDDMALWFGSHNIERMHPHLGELLENKRRLLQTGADGKKMGGKDASFELSMLAQIDALYARIKQKGE